MKTTRFGRVLMVLALMPSWGISTSLPLHRTPGAAVEVQALSPAAVGGWPLSKGLLSFRVERRVWEKVKPLILALDQHSPGLYAMLKEKGLAYASMTGTPEVRFPLAGDPFSQRLILGAFAHGYNEANRLSPSDSRYMHLPVDFLRFVVAHEETHLEANKATMTRVGVRGKTTPFNLLKNFFLWTGIRGKERVFVKAMQEKVDYLGDEFDPYLQEFLVLSALRWTLFPERPSFLMDLLGRNDLLGSTFVSKVEKYLHETLLPYAAPILVDWDSHMYYLHGYRRNNANVLDILKRVFNTNEDIERMVKRVVSLSVNGMPTTAIKTFPSRDVSRISLRSFQFLNAAS